MDWLINFLKSSYVSASLNAYRIYTLFFKKQTPEPIPEKIVNKPNKITIKVKDNPGTIIGTIGKQTNNYHK